MILLSQLPLRFFRQPVFLICFTIHLSIFRVDDKVIPSPTNNLCCDLPRRSFLTLRYLISLSAVSDEHCQYSPICLMYVHVFILSLSAIIPPIHRKTFGE